MKDKESALLQKISTGFPKEFWDKYKALVKKRQAEALSEEEYQLLNEMGDRLEIANAERIRNLSQLADLRHVSLPAIMNELGIKPVQHG